MPAPRGAAQRRDPRDGAPVAALPLRGGGPAHRGGRRGPELAPVGGGDRRHRPGQRVVRRRGARGGGLLPRRSRSLRPPASCGPSRPRPCARYATWRCTSPGSAESPRNARRTWGSRCTSWASTRSCTATAAPSGCGAPPKRWSARSPTGHRGGPTHRAARPGHRGARRSWAVDGQPAVRPGPAAFLGVGDDRAGAHLALRLALDQRLRELRELAPTCPGRRLRERRWTSAAGPR